MHAHLIPPCPHVGLVGISGRKLLARQLLPEDERVLAQIDQIEASLKLVDADIARYALQDPGPGGTSSAPESPT